MENTFEYSLIRVEPDSRRGERVNVGIVVFNNGKLDIRVVDTRKATAISSQKWDDYIRVFASNLNELFNQDAVASDLVRSVDLLGRQVNLSNTGWFITRSAEDYERHVKRIIETLVSKPRAARRPKETSIATEIAAGFRSAEILSVHGEPLENGKVVRNFTVDEGAGLVAEFALQNGHLHLATTVNLTSGNPHIGSSASKAITMDKAKKERQARTYCVYAVAPSRKPEVREHLSLLGDYSDHIFNWIDPDEKRKFQRIFYDAYMSNLPTAIDQAITRN